MTSTEIALHQPQTDLAQQMDFARTVVVQPERGAQSILPKEYQNNPANVLIAVGLGSSMGLSPAESLYRITVIQGKPTASAELIAANVRKAGHKLRVRGDDTSCTATIIRADDPDYEFTVTRDLEWARAMQLTGKDNYKKQPGTMLQWRAITAVARLACPEALYGVVYSSDEVIDDRLAQPDRPTGGLAGALAAQDQPEPERPAEDITTPASPGSVTSGQIKKIGAAMGDLGLTDRAVALKYVADEIGREVKSRNDLSKNEAGQVIDALERDIAERNAADKETGEIHDAEVVDEALPDPADENDPWKP